MQKLNLSQTFQQKLSPQQIQFIKLLQVPTAELESRIEEELELNPTLEEGEEDEREPEQETEVTEEEPQETETSDPDDEIDIKDYLRDDDYNSYKTYSDDGDDDEEDREMPIPMGSSLHETLLTQLGFLGLDDKLNNIGKQLIGSIEGDGYIRREIESIVNDLAFSQGIDTNLEEVEDVLRKIQSFDPAGIAARNLQECILLQLERMDDGQDVDVLLW